MRRLVIIREDKVGDNCVATSLLESLRAQMPETEVAWVCQAGNRCLVEHHPLVTEVWPHTTKPRLREQFELASQIRRWKADAVVALRINCTRMQIAGLLSGARIRAGVRTERLRRPLLNRNAYPEWSQCAHEAMKSLSVLKAAVGPLESRPAKVYLPRSVEKRTYVVIHLGTGGSNRPWHPRCFGEVARELDAPIVLTGAPSERPHVAEFARAFGGTFDDRVGATDLPAFLRVCAGASLVVAVDSGATHIATAVGTRCVALFPNRASRPDAWHPWGPNHVVVPAKRHCSVCEMGSCRWSETTCLDSIEVDQVVRACLGERASLLTT